MTDTTATVTPELQEELEHCMPLNGGKVHELMPGMDVSDGRPEVVFPLCRTGAMTNQGTRYRKVTADLTCVNCVENRKRRHAHIAAQATAPVVEESAPVEESPDDAEREKVTVELAARLSAGLVWSTARDFQAVPSADGGPVIGWTFRVRSGSIIRYGFVATRGLVLDTYSDLPRREDAERELVAHRQAGTDTAELMPPVAMYLEQVRAEHSTEELAEFLHILNVDVVKAEPEGTGRLVVTRGPDFYGTIFDAGCNMERGQFEAWSPYAGTRHNIVGFYDTVEEATAAIAHAWPVAAWELAEETGRSVHAVLDVAEELAADGARVALRIVGAVGPDTKIDRDAAVILRQRLALAPNTPEPLTVRQAKELVSATYPEAEAFEPFRVEAGRFIGYTFRVGRLHSAGYGWITLAGTYAKALDHYRSTASDVLIHADRDDRRVPRTNPVMAAEARDIVRRVHADAHTFQVFHRPGEGEPVGWTFRTGYSSAARYGVITVMGEISPIGLYEYPTTAQRAFLQAELDAAADQA